MAAGQGDEKRAIPYFLGYTEHGLYKNKKSSQRFFLSP
jgi:hypothetical protein